MTENTKPLTPRQQDTLSALDTYCRAQAIPPTLYELKTILNVSPPRIHKLLSELLEAGAVVKIKDRGKSRSYVPTDSKLAREGTT